MENVFDDIYRAYYDTVFNVSKAILNPIVDSITITLTDAVTKSVKNGIENAAPQVNLWDIIMGKRNANGK